MFLSLEVVESSPVESPSQRTNGFRARGVSTFRSVGIPFSPIGTVTACPLPYATCIFRVGTRLEAWEDWSIQRSHSPRLISKYEYIQYLMHAENRDGRPMGRWKPPFTRIFVRASSGYMSLWWFYSCHNTNARITYTYPVLDTFATVLGLALIQA